VRHKFLRSAQTEMGHAIEAVTRIALAHPHIHFTLAHNGRVMHDLPPVDNIRQRIAAFFGDDLAGDLIEVHSENEGITLTGYVANPMHSRATGRMQYLFLNGRAIRDRSLQHALCEAYRGLMLTGRQPICFLRLDMPPALVCGSITGSATDSPDADLPRSCSSMMPLIFARSASNCEMMSLPMSSGERR